MIQKRITLYQEIWRRQLLAFLRSFCQMFEQLRTSSGIYAEFTYYENKTPSTNADGNRTDAGFLGKRATCALLKNLARKN